MSIENDLRELARTYSTQLKSQIERRVEEIQRDDQSHFLIYRVLGVTAKEGKMIDVYQNKGRFLYKYAGSFLEEAAKLCFKHRFPHSGTVKIPNTAGQRPKTFEIDCLIESNAIEIKWRDATTDGDHINKEHTRIKVISDAGYRPIRIMFYYPNRIQARKIQETLKTLYKGINGEYYRGDDAWNYIQEQSGFDLKALLEKIARENDHKR